MSFRSRPRGLLLAVAGGLALLVLLARFETTSMPLSMLDLTQYKSRPISDDRLLQDTHNRTLGFQKIFVINMPSRTDLRDSMTLAAALTPGKLDVEFVDGVSEVAEKALPPGGNSPYIDVGSRGAWRAHMNVIRTIVEQDLTSALVLEADADWDVRVKQQMQDFARASRLLVQPGRTNEAFEIADEPTLVPTTSPYGDVASWDLLWVGHCGTRIPRSNETLKVPFGRVVQRDDETVPELQHVDTGFGNKSLLQGYPHHTRVSHRSIGNVCSLAYGISQAGARRFLYELGVRELNGPFDLMAREMCDGRFGSRPMHNCLTVQPPIFQPHRPAGYKSSFSDIAEFGTDWNDVPFTDNIRWSTRVNFPKLVNNEYDYIDQYPDGAPSKKQNQEHINVNAVPVLDASLEENKA